MSPPFRASALIGAELGEHRIVQLLASGGMGHVYAATDRERQRHVALKLLRPELARKTSHRERFEREAQAASATCHENIVRVEAQVHEEDGHRFFMMELLRGLDAADTLAQQGSLSSARAARIVRGAARGLAALHEAGVVHRDVKPENLFLVHAADGREVVKVIDFGSAWVSTGVTAPIDEPQIPLPLGTPEYAPPEGFQVSVRTGAADVYSLGLVLHEILGGRLPIETRPASPSGREPGLDALLRAMLSVRQEDRPTATEVDRALAALFDGS